MSQTQNENQTQNETQTENQNETEQKLEQAEQVLKLKVKTNVRGGPGHTTSNKEWME